MRYLLALLVTLIAISGFADEPDTILHKKCIYPTVLISSNISQGSGVIIKSVYHKEHDFWLNTVLSSAHVVKKGIFNPKYKILVGEYKDWSTLEKYNEFDCHVYRKDEEKDTIVLTFWSKEKMPVAEINSKEKLYIGNDIMRIGCGLGEEMRLDYGRITSMNSKIMPGRWRTSIFCVPGDSGGPVFHRNKVVGIVQAIRYMHTEEGVRTPIPQMSYIIPLDWFHPDDIAIEPEEPKENPIWLPMLQRIWAWCMQKSQQ